MSWLNWLADRKTTLKCGNGTTVMEMILRITGIILNDMMAFILASKCKLILSDSSVNLSFLSLPDICHLAIIVITFTCHLSFLSLPDICHLAIIVNNLYLSSVCSVFTRHLSSSYNCHLSFSFLCSYMQW